MQLHQTFLSNHFSIWLQALSSVEERGIHQAILNAGMDTFLNLEILRHYQDTKSDPGVISQLQKVALQNPDIAHGFIPVFFSSYIQALDRHRGALFSQNSQSHSPLDRSRQTAMACFSSLVGILEGFTTISSWKTMLELLEIIKRDNIHRGQPSPPTISNILQTCLETLQRGQKGRKSLEA